MLQYSVSNSCSGNWQGRACTEITLASPKNNC